MVNVHNANMSEIGISLVRTEEISMITIKQGPGCWNRPLISGTVGTREDGTRKHPVDVESILCSLFCGESKDEILKKCPDMTEQDFEDALTFCMYAVSKFNGDTKLKWDKNSSENYWGR